ncbi:Co2+/Mg2+ efflux protein ApaG [Paludibacterium yongneupense]|uniref:Co2+/Mg2+ efflux protein ApaG n=1 Tax=Paludibacterium yongneupense TaxID=400061 RepID=UPI000428ABA6|nr:Co2+/Mg2+ efflux protein ApaG [Paludibacterium yongneupense]
MNTERYKLLVQPESAYSEEKSNLAADVYAFGYTIRITNLGAEPAQLVSRHWIITDANEQVQEVRGLGVVGEQPWIEPGAQFEYSSITSLKTPFGSMRGRYQMVSQDGTRFDAEIPEMVLVARRVLH